MELPARFASIHDPHGERAKTAKYIIASLMKSYKFRNAKAQYRSAIVIGIERGILNCAITFMENNNQIASWTLHSFIKEYKRKRYLLCSMLDLIGNGDAPFLEMSIMKHSIDWDRLAFARVSELDPAKYAHIIRDLQLRSKAEISFQFIEGTIPCSNCKSKKYKEYSVQWASLDESAYYFRMCGGCGKRSRG
jgi:DNA-directed RNA polymerase subunit M/transcription elongation factor TFIIS